MRNKVAKRLRHEAYESYIRLKRPAAGLEVRKRFKEIISEAGSKTRLTRETFRWHPNSYRSIYQRLKKLYYARRAQV